MEMEMERDWASLERGLLRNIFTRLPSDVDAVSFRGVCPGWRVAAGAGGPVPRPWFILNPADKGGPPAAGHAFVRPVDRRRRHTRIRSAVRVESAAAAVTGGGCPPAPPACVVRGTSRGWLAVNEGERLLLRDPISRSEIPLPPTFDAAAGYQLSDIFLSDDPLAAPGGWTAFAFFRWGNDDVCTNTYSYSYNHNPGDVLAFCRPGDAEWTRVDPDNNDGLQLQGHGQQQTRLIYRGLEFFGGRPYVLLAKPNASKLAICDVEARRLVVSSVRIFESSSSWQQECLVECAGDLLVVQVAKRDEYYRSPPCPCYYFPGVRHCCFERHRVRYYAKAFKIRFDAGGSGMPVASEAVASTGDYAVFVAPRGHAFALPASGFPTVRAGCVYCFAVNYTRSVQGMVIVDLLPDPTRAQRDKFVRELPVTGNWHILAWFCPRPVLDTTPPPPPPLRRRRRWMHGLRNALPFFQF